MRGPGRRFGRHFDAVIIAILASGCSWLYDPDDLPVPVIPEPPPDPVDPDLLKLNPLPATSALLEGVGDDGSRPAVLVVTGEHITESATITITGMDDKPVPGVELAGPPIISAGYGESLAVPVIARVNRMLPTGAEIPLKVTVAQAGLTSVVSQVVQWKLRGFDELISTATVTHDTSLSPAPTYSVVNITGGLNAAGTSPANPLLIRSNSSITIGGNIEVDADDENSGAGGGVGGPSSGPGSGPGAGRGATSGVLGMSHGGGAGFVTAAGGTLNGPLAGDPLITHYEEYNCGSGGGGGAALLGLPGGVGGGGGGTVELSALGTTTLLGTVSAQGGDGAGGTNNGGGGGSGGVIVVRGGIKVDARLAFDVSGGAAPNGTNGGAAGRIRIDAPEWMISDNTKNQARRGPTFPASFPPTTDKEELTFTLLGSPGAKVEVVTSNIEQTSAAPVAINFENADAVPVKMKLHRGYNRICVAPVSTMSLSKAGSTNCAEVAYIRNYVPMK